MRSDNKLDAVPDIGSFNLAEDNCGFWDQVSYTPPSFTKEVSFGRSYTAVDPQFQALMATKLFGPCGMGWGLRNCELKFEDFPVIKKGKVLDSIKTAILTCEFWYRWNDELHTMEVMVDMPAKSDDDTLKKLQTMARSKALSWLGFSSDIYLGLFDDDAYVKDAKTRQRVDADSEGFLRDAADMISDAKTIEELDRLLVRADQMLANRIVTPEIAGELKDRIAAAKEEFK